MTLTHPVKRNTRNKYPSIIFRFVFFQNGLFQADLRACNRRALSQAYITDNTLAVETLAFATALDSNLRLRGTIVGGLDQLVNSAVTNFQSYMSKLKNINDCLVTKAIQCLKVIHTTYDVLAILELVNL